jgi:hypothetical protein
VATTTTIFDRDDLDLIAAFAGCSLDSSPGSNWVQETGGLPEYICQIARAIKRTGKTTSQAIAIAVSRCKKWAAGADNVDADTRAKAAKAIAQWEAKKAKARATPNKNTVKASNILAMTPVPGALDRVVAYAATAAKPYGDVPYADPGYRAGRKRYPIDTAAHVRAAWSYINQADNASEYSAAQLAAIKAKIKAAARRLGVNIADGG